MKKLKLILLSFFLFFPFFVKADTVNYNINHYYINANILENGDLEITELIVLKGKFNGYIRDIIYKNSLLGEEGYTNNHIYNARDIEILEIAAKKVNNITFETISDLDFTSLKLGQGSNYGYLENKINNGKSYKMYFKSNGDTVAFRLKYIVKDAIVLHEDVAELYWTFIGSEYEDMIKDLQIKVNLPNKDDSGNFRIWAHGEIAGEVRPFENKYLLATVNKLNAYNSVDIRTTFDASLMNKNRVNKKTEKEALNEILKVETKKAEKANQERERMRKIYYTFFGISLVYLLALLIAWIYVYLKYDKEYKSTFHLEYNREFIDDYNVEVVDYLINKKITPNAMSASIMNLIFKKVIKVEEIKTDKKTKEYRFTLLDKEKCNETEKYLINFLFQKVGHDNTFTTKELHGYAKGTKTCEKFSVCYTSWKNKVVRDGKDQKFFENKAKAIRISVLFLLGAFFLQIIISALSVVSMVSAILFVLCIFFLLYTCFLFKRTKKGNEDYVRWMAFKKFLNDFGSFPTKELPEITLWERYMVYATVFGLANKVSKVMNVKIKELETMGVYVSGYTPTFNDWYIFHSITNSINHSVNANTTAITATRANSSSSSGKGFGGGFSSGGGFGGGGGGGRGF